MPDTQYLTDEDEEELTPEELAQIQRAPNEVVNVNAQGPGDIPTVDAALPNADHLVEPTDASGPVDPRTIGAINPAGMDDIDPNAAPDAAPTPASTPSLAWTKAVNPANGQTVNVPASSRYDQAISNYEKLLSQAPTKSDPKWWQRAAAMGVGALAGYSNAASRTRNPIDIAAAKEGILQPTYASKLDAWRSRVAPAQAQLELATQQVGAQQAAAENAAKIAQQGAEAKMQTEHGDYYKNRGEQERNQWKIDPKTGQLYNTITGQVQSKPPTVQDRMATAKGLGFDDESARVYGLTGKLPVDKPERAPTEWSSYLDAAGGDAGKALKLQQDARIRIARESRPPAAAGADSGLDDEAVDQAAKAYNAGAGLPNLGFGKESATIKKAIINRAAKLNPGGDLAGAKQDYAANTGVIRDLDKTAARVRTSEGTASRNLDLAESISQKTDRTGSPILNKYLLFLNGQVAGDDNTTLLNNAVETAANEYAGVVTAGSGGGNAATDSARQHARDMLHSAMAKGTFTKVVAQMKQEMANRQASFQDSLKQARSGRNPQQQQPGQQSQPQATQPSGGRPMVQHSPSTGQYRYSTDGGKTWIPGQPPQ